MLRQCQRCWSLLIDHPKEMSRSGKGKFIVISLGRPDTLEVYSVLLPRCCPRATYLWFRIDRVDTICSTLHFALTSALSN